MVFIQAPQVDGKKELYEKNCKRCHGVDGTKHFFGAKNLQISTLDSINTTRIIENGSGIMPAFREKLQVEEIAKISSYVKRLRKP